MCHIRLFTLVVLALGNCCHGLRASAPLQDSACIACVERDNNSKWCIHSYDNRKSYCQQVGESCCGSYTKVKTVLSCPAAQEEQSIEGDVHSVVVRLQNETDQLDHALDTEAGQEAAKAKADQLKKTNPLTWITSKIATVGSLMKKAILAVYNFMKDWLVGLCTWAAEGGLDDVVDFVKDGLTAGFASLRELLQKVWAFFDMIFEKTKIKHTLSYIIKKVGDLVKSIFGGSSSEPSLLGLEQNQSIRVESELPETSFLELVHKDSLPRGIIKNSTVIEAIVPNKFLMFVLSVVVDAIGMSSYAANAAAMMGEVLDVAWAPLHALWLREFFDGSMTIATIGFLEEILPFMDAVPTATMGWFFSYNNWIGCGVFRTILWLPDRSMIGYGACPQSVLSDISSKGYKIKKAKSKGHLYLQCQHGSRALDKVDEKQKASCVEKECKAVGGWCFVNNHCGGLREGSCEELDNKDPLECKSSDDR